MDTYQFKRVDDPVPDYVKNGTCVYQDPTRSVWLVPSILGDTIMLEEPSFPDGIHIAAAPDYVLRDFLKALVTALGTQNARIVSEGYP